jgi:multidrug efflux pump subunit AcrA (membrane-fusion protein)
MKILLIVVLALSAAGGGWWYWKQSHPEEVKYQTGVATRGDVTQVVNATGQLNPGVECHGRQPDFRQYHRSSTRIIIPW